MDDATLERKLYPPVPAVPVIERTMPDWSQVHRQLRRKGVTLALLWHEYKATHPEGYQYSWFCKQYRAWVGKLDVVMRQEHRGGEKLFVDYAGQTVENDNLHWPHLIFYFGPTLDGKKLLYVNSWLLSEPVDNSPRRGHGCPRSVASYPRASVSVASACGQGWTTGMLSRLVHRRRG